MLAILNQTRPVPGKLLRESVSPGLGMSRDFERLIRSSGMPLYAAMARVTLRRLAKRTN